MTEQQLRRLPDDGLLHSLRKRADCEREAMTDVLRHLLEVERRKLFASRGHSSMFEFCMGEMNYSESQAHSRIQAMRLLRSVPEAEEKIESGELSLSVAAAAQATFRRAAKQNQAVSVESKRAIVNQLVNTSVRKAEQILLSHVPGGEVPREKTKAVAAEVMRIEFNAKDMLYKKLERLKNLTAHKNFGATWEGLFEILTDLGLEHFEPKMVALGREVAQIVSAAKQIPNAPLLGTSQVKVARVVPEVQAPKHQLKSNATRMPSRFIPVNVKRIVWRRDNGCCQFKDLVSGRQCGSRYGIQYDHIHKFENGGRPTAENLRLLCGTHNRLRL